MRKRYRHRAVYLLVLSMLLVFLTACTAKREATSGDMSKNDTTENTSTENTSTENASTENTSTENRPAENASEDTGRDSKDQTQWAEAEHTPYGKYPDTVSYTLGKISGANNSNLPVGDTYEDNAYTRYLKKKLNIQNEDIFELEDGDTYEQALEMAIADNDIPDVLVVKGRDNLEQLVKRGLIQELDSVYEECTTDRIKEMYGSYEDGLLESATFDGKLYAFPDTVIDHGSMLLWMRKDWIDELQLEEPTTLDEAMSIIQQFVSKDLAGNGSTIGLACSTSLVSESSSTYGVDPVFTAFGSSPGKWVLNGDGNVEYGSVSSSTKEALSYLHDLYENGTLDSRFLLRTSDNLDALVAEGNCGAIFGSWWAPNNPLAATSRLDQAAVWKPYLLTGQNQQRTLEDFRDRQYVVVRKGFEHPEIVGKSLSILFDYTRYEDLNASEINDYFSLNVDPTARPMNINIDYWDGLYRTTDNIQAALNGEKRVQELSGIEKAYFQTCKSYLNGSLTTVNGWAAYASRIQAVSLLSESGRGVQSLPAKNTEVEMPQSLSNLEKHYFLQIISGDLSLDAFDEYVEKWYKSGGEELTRQMQEQLSED